MQGIDYTRRPRSLQAISDKKGKDGSNVKNTLEILYGLPREKTHGQDAPFAGTAWIESEHLELLTAFMTDGQRERMAAYLGARCRAGTMLDFDRFRFAFHAGAYFLAECAKKSLSLPIDRLDFCRDASQTETGSRILQFRSPFPSAPF